MNPVSLGADEIDTLQELFNIGIGRAAASLSKLVHQKVLMTVPEVTVCTADDLRGRFTATQIRAVEQKIGGPFGANCALVFPDEREIEIVKAMVGANLPAEMVAELQEEALNELGNIVINACIGAISRAIGEPIEVSVPTFRVCSSDTLFRSSSDDSTEDLVLLLQVEMALDRGDMDGYLAFILESDAIVDVRRIVSRMLEGLVGSLDAAG